MLNSRLNGHNTAAAFVADERRAHQRYHFTACVAAIDTKHRTTLNARTSDLGRGGCYVDAFCPFPVQSDVKLRLTCEKRSFVAQAKVVYSRMGMGMGLQFTSVERSQLPVLDQWIGELDGTAPLRSDSCEQAGEIEMQMEMPVDREQWYVLHELVIGLMRSGIVGHEEGKAMLQKLLDQNGEAL